MFAEGSVSLVQLCFLIVLIGLRFKLMYVKVDEAARTFNELPLAEGVYISPFVPTTILLNFFIFL
jgi:hypothetical protein